MSTTSKQISRRDFLKYAGAGVAGGMAVIVVGNKLGWLTGSKSYAATQTLHFTIGDVMKNMHTHDSINNAQCYFWVYKCTDAQFVNLPAECPGPTIVASHGDTISIDVTNSLDEPHTLAVPSLGISGTTIPAGGHAIINIPASICGSHLYYDNLNEPVNRVMGLHGAIIVMPVEGDRTAGGHKLTPYGGLAAGHGVQRLYDDFGSAHFPGLAWEEGDATPWSMDATKVNTPPFRQYIWLLHQASPKLFAEVGNYTAGQDYPATQFMNLFLRDTFQPHAFHTDNPNGNHVPQYFTINGQSGFFSHFNPTITPMGRVGEPVVVHILNAGLWTHSMHLHANHMWVTSVNTVANTNPQPNPNPIWVDVFRVDPMMKVDYTIPFMRPPDVGNEKGIGPVTLAEPKLQTDNGHPLWPPTEEFNVYIPALGTKAKNAAGQDVELGQRMSPLCYPMHDHSEPSQTSQGGNYNTGLISGIYFTGDRNGLMDFPMDEDFHMMYQNIRGVAVTQQAAPIIGA